jgi:hypothetical protein
LLFRRHDNSFFQFTATLNEFLQPKKFFFSHFVSSAELAILRSVFMEVLHTRRIERPSLFPLAFASGQDRPEVCHPQSLLTACRMGGCISAANQQSALRSPHPRREKVANGELKPYDHRPAE